jgi:hypothetical protein
MYQNSTENSIAVALAPPEMAAQVNSRSTLPTMLAKLQCGQSIKDVRTRAQGELEGFVR